MCYRPREGSSIHCPRKQQLSPRSANGILPRIQRHGSGQMPPNASVLQRDGGPEVEACTAAAQIVPATTLSQTLQNYWTSTPARCASGKLSSGCHFKQILSLLTHPDVQVIPQLQGDATEQTPPDLPSYLFKERIVYLVRHL